MELKDIIDTISKDIEAAKIFGLPCMSMKYYIGENSNIIMNQVSDFFTEKGYSINYIRCLGDECSVGVRIRWSE